MADMPAPATVRQPPGAVRSYAAELLALARRLDPASGWFAVFAEHDPDGLRECLSGREMPPWDVVASLLEDLRRQHGPGAARQAEEQLRPLHGTAATAYDLHAGGEPVLRRRLAAAAGELDEAAARVRALEPGGGAEQAWAHDYLVRVEARCEELRARLAALTASGQAEPAHRDAHPGAGGEGSAADAGSVADAASAAPPAKRRVRSGGSRFAGALDEETEAGGPAPIVPPGAPTPDLAPRSGGAADAGPVADAASAAPPAKRRVRSGGSRFAGAPGEETEAGGPAPIVPPGAPTPDLAPLTGGAGGPGDRDDAAPSGELAPRGARFAGSVPRPAEAGTLPSPDEIAQARALADEAAARLVRLRRAGAGGEAHALLCEAAHWPPFRFAVLVDELQGRGLAPDAGTLLWEAADLPAGAFAAAAAALAALGRGEDGVRMLRQGVSRPPREIAEAALALHRAGREHEARELLAAVIRARTPAGAAQVVRAEPAVLAGLVLEAARAMSHEQLRRVADALRTAEVPGVPRAL
ncbi:hypothetical protein [Streptomyces winkii]|uniref:hypothetical protein n=1 Tax=Streptomyces winkii TaxID=3051178 RepID=UPI0028D4E144|nr:hypothetical protein [Streptomyces sp. DSM 40971]